MIVDDNVDLTNVVKEGLEGKSNYKVTIANSGMECFEILNKGKIPDLILLDIMMPEVSGWKTFSKIRETWKDIPIIFITGRTDLVAEKAGKFFGEDYIEKPFAIKDLKTRIDKVLVSIDKKLGEMGGKG